MLCWYVPAGREGMLVQPCCWHGCWRTQQQPSWHQPVRGTQSLKLAERACAGKSEPGQACTCLCPCKLVQACTSQASLHRRAQAFACMCKLAQALASTYTQQHAYMEASISACPYGGLHKGRPIWRPPYGQAHMEASSSCSNSSNNSPYGGLQQLAPTCGEEHRV